MIRTADDVRRALEVEADPAAERRLLAVAADLDSGGDHPPRTVAMGRRVWLPAVGVAAAVAVIAGSAAVIGGGHDHGRAPTGRAAALTPAQIEALRPTWGIAAKQVSGYRISLRSAASRGPVTGGTYASISATSTRRPETGGISTCPGKPDECIKPSGVRPQQVRIGGVAGDFYPGRHVDRNGLIESSYRLPWTAAAENNEYQPQLIWSTRGVTTVLDGTFGFDPTTYDYDNQCARTLMLRIADALTVGRRDTVHAPFALRHLPDTIAPEAIRLGTGYVCLGYGSGRGPYPGEWVGSVATACRVRTQPTRGRTIHAADAIDAGETSTVAVHDFPDGTSIVVEVDQKQQGVVSADEAKVLARQADVSPGLSTPSTWLPVG